MNRKSKTAVTQREFLPKCRTGINGFDEITMGGLPRGRPTLVCGSAGSGKTLLGIEFLFRGAIQFNEPGVCISFEEKGEDLAQNVRSLGFDLDALIKSKKLAVDYVHIDKSQIDETGDYDLEGLFIRIGAAIDSVGAKRVLIDTPEALFAGLTNEGILRSELRRLFGWLKSRGVTAVITGERGTHTLTRYGLEEYISDCVILLDQRVQDGSVTRRLRVLKYRGTSHGTNEYPFLIDDTGFSVLPITSLGLEYDGPTERISSGAKGLDEMLGGQGFFRGSSILMSGTAGTGKTSLAAHFIDAACRRGEPCIYFAFEESPGQLYRNMKSVGIDLERWAKKGLLHIHAARPTTFGIEMHLVQMHKLLMQHKPQAVVVDPLSSLTSAGSQYEVQTLVLRMIDHLKTSGATAFFTTLTSGADALETTGVQVSSLVDTWLLLRDVEADGERNRVIYVLKSRGMAHSNQLREFRITSHGAELLPAYLGPGGVLTGSARLMQEAREREAEARQREDAKQKELVLTRRLRSLEAQIAELNAERAAQEMELKSLFAAQEESRAAVIEQRATMAASRKVVEPAAAVLPNGRGPKP